jgi:hydroxymethylbilane synthase
MSALTCATRRSALALAQCRAFIDALRARTGERPIRELQIVTTGDRVQDRPLAEIGGKGLFVKEIEEALLDGRADFAVHSMKDMPAALPPGLTLACVPRRADPRDALVSPHGGLGKLAASARVGTSSLRRAVALRAHRPDLVIQPLRGNVDTRLRKVDSGEVDAIVIAYAGLIRLGLQARVTEVLPMDICLPAPGQGALGIECREDDRETRTVLATMHDIETAVCVAAERGVLSAVGGDCRTPLGAHADRVAMGDMRLRAFVARQDGTLRKAEQRTGWPETEAQAREFGLSLGQTLER